jgi:hypothetical protein
VLGVGYLKQKYAEHKASVEKAKIETPATSNSSVQRQRTSKTFSIPQGCLEKRLEVGPDIYPKGGAVKYTAPSGKVYTTLPGVDMYRTYEPAGIYIFCPEPKGSDRGVEIYNWW